MIFWNTIPLQQLCLPQYCLQGSNHKQMNNKDKGNIQEAKKYARKFDILRKITWYENLLRALMIKVK